MFTRPSAPAERVSISTACGSCGTPITLTYVPRTGLSSVWVCPETGCARDNLLSGAASILKAELPQPRRPEQ